jgi:hypothetical protein
MPYKTAKTGEVLLTTEITYFRKPCLVVCDQKCTKAWGHNGGRPELSRDEDDEDNVVWLGDNEVDLAPESGIIEGIIAGEGGRPTEPPQKHNRWCVRECERSSIIDPGQPIACADWTQRIYNQPWKHRRTENAKLVANDDAVFVPGKADF